MSSFDFIASKISKVGDVVGNVRDGASRVGSGVLDMLSPTGGDGEGHVKKSSTSTERFNLLRDLKASVHEVVTSEFREEKINTENHPCVFKLCVDVERVCFYRLHRVGSFWDFISIIGSLDIADPSFSETLFAFQNSLRIVRLSPNVTTSLGRSRAWIRCALNMKILDACLHYFSQQHMLVKRFYDDHSFMSDTSSNIWTSILTAAVGKTFNIEINDPTLDKDNKITLISTIPDEKNEMAKKSEAYLTQREKRDSINKSHFEAMVQAEELRSKLNDTTFDSNAISYSVNDARTSSSTLNYSPHEDRKASGPITSFFGAGLSFVRKATGLGSPSRPVSGSFNPDAFAGLNLDQLVQDPAHCSSALLDPYLGVPDLIVEIIKFLRERLDTPQLFRKFAGENEISNLRLAFEMERVIPRNSNVHAVAALLLSILRTFPEPILTFEFFHPFIACRLIELTVDKIRNIKLLLYGLPELHKPTLSLLVTFLNEVSQHGSVNDTSIEFLAQKFGPEILRPSADDGAIFGAGGLSDVGNSYTVIQALLEHHVEILSDINNDLKRYREELAARLNNINLIYKDQSIAVDDSIEEHYTLISNLWQGLMNNEPIDEGGLSVEVKPFAMVSNEWKTHGFQGKNPVTDFRGGGLASLKNLLYFVTNHRSTVSSIVKNNFFPFSLAAVNITRMILELIGIDVHNKVDFKAEDLAPLPFWTLADDSDAFNKLFCMAFLLLENNWNETQATKMDFNRSLLDVKSKMFYLLQIRPNDVEEMWRNWIDTRAEEDDSGKTIKNVFARPRSLSNADPGNVISEENESPDEKKLEEDLLPLLSDPSEILTPEYLSFLDHELPPQYKGYDWKLIFSLSKNGASLDTLYSKAAKEGGNVIIIKDRNGHIFGGFVTETWKNVGRYYGNGTCFVFSLHPKQVAYPWTRKNNFFMLANEECIAMGGGGNFGWYLDHELKEGSSGACKTFDSPLLSSEDNFEAVVVEVWSFKLRGLNISKIKEGERGIAKMFRSPSNSSM